MVRVGVSVEGATEERFVKMVLGPYLLNRGIHITPIPVNGDLSVDKVRGELRKIGYNFDFVTTLYDFYGFKNKNPNEDKESLEQRIINCAHPSIRNKLIPYIQMYEFEGLLFSCPTSMERGMNEKGVKSWCESTLSKFSYNPEAINNSVNTSPSKRLERSTSYRKTTHGPNIAKEIGIEKIREMCVGFDKWLLALESLEV